MTLLRQAIANKRDGIRQLWSFDNRWRLVADRLLRRPVSTYVTGDVRIVVDHAAGDAPGVRDVFATPMYRSLIGRLELPPRLRVLDVGAHIGSFTLLLAALGHDVADATLVELNPATCTRLRHNVSINLGAGARVVNAAVCGDGRSFTVALGRGGTGDSFEHGSLETTATDVTRIPGTTIDELVGGAADPIDICKLDIEGAEYDVLAHPHHGALQRCRNLIVEVHDRDGDRPHELVEQICALGFTHVVRPATVVGVHALRNTAIA